MNTLQKPYYNNKGYMKPVLKDPPSEVTSKATSDDTSYETPYDIAKKRQSQLPEEPSMQQTTVQRSVSDVPEFELDPQRKRADYHIKLVVVGDGGCGKTCLLISYSQGEFPTVYVPTIFENYVTNVKGPNNKVIELALWDTAGQEEYDRLRPLSYPDVNILLVCYAINNVTSLHNVKETWTPEVKHFCPGIPIILVGTKMDLTAASEDFVDFHEAERVAQEIGASDHIRCSAKTTENINHVFNVALTAALKNIDAVNAANVDNRKSLKNRFSRQFVKKNETQVFKEPTPPPVVSDYYKNSEYGLSDAPARKKKKRRCVIL